MARVIGSGVVTAADVESSIEVHHPMPRGEGDEPGGKLASQFTSWDEQSKDGSKPRRKDLMKEKEKTKVCWYPFKAAYTRRGIHRKFNSESDSTVFSDNATSVSAHNRGPLSVAQTTSSTASKTTTTMTTSMSGKPSPDVYRIPASVGKSRRMPMLCIKPPIVSEVSLYEYSREIDGDNMSHDEGTTELVLNGHPMPSDFKELPPPPMTAENAEAFAVPEDSSLLDSSSDSSSGSDSDSLTGSCAESGPSYDEETEFSYSSYTVVRSVNDDRQSNTAKRAATMAGLNTNCMENGFWGNVDGSDKKGEADNSKSTRSNWACFDDGPILGNVQSDEESESDDENSGKRVKDKTGSVSDTTKSSSSKHRRAHSVDLSAFGAAHAMIMRVTSSPNKAAENRTEKAKEGKFDQDEDNDSEEDLDHEEDKDSEEDDIDVSTFDGTFDSTNDDGSYTDTIDSQDFDEESIDSQNDLTSSALAQIENFLRSASIGGAADDSDDAKSKGGAPREDVPKKTDTFKSTARGIHRGSSSSKIVESSETERPADNMKPKSSPKEPLSDVLDEDNQEQITEEDIFTDEPTSPKAKLAHHILPTKSSRRLLGRYRNKKKGSAKEKDHRETGLGAADPPAAYFRSVGNSTLTKEDHNVDRVTSLIDQASVTSYSVQYEAEMESQVRSQVIKSGRSKPRPGKSQAPVLWQDGEAQFEDIQFDDVEWTAASQSASNEPSAFGFEPSFESGFEPSFESGFEPGFEPGFEGVRGTDSWVQRFSSEARDFRSALRDYSSPFTPSGRGKDKRPGLLKKGSPKSVSQFTNGNSGRSHRTESDLDWPNLGPFDDSSDFEESFATFGSTATISVIKAPRRNDSYDDEDNDTSWLDDSSELESKAFQVYEDTDDDSLFSDLRSNESTEDDARELARNPWLKR